MLDRFCAPLFDAVLADEITTSRQILHELERTNLFLIPLDDERRRYRYHHLLASFLSRRLRAKESERIPKLHRRTSQWHGAREWWR